MRASRLIAAVVLVLVAGLAVAAEFDGNCAVSLSEGRMFKTRCTIKSEYEGKEYCFSSEASKDIFLENPQAIIMKAKAFYAKNAEPVREKSPRSKRWRKSKALTAIFQTKMRAI